ncbi:MAG TPA: class I SAM-dependent methyltransferase [Rickettsiales bacterium]|nr:class I SAM-dependent methyltransferase [Rickettsiales bacterium]
MDKDPIATADSTAVRVALWRALHVLSDPAPHILEDEVGLQLASPPENWRQRPDMNLQGTQGYRAAIVSRSRFIDDLVIEQYGRGIAQYIILGAGLDSFAQRHKNIASQMRVFEVDKPSASLWKKQRLIELGFGVPDWLHLVPVDFESGESWLQELISSGFDPKQPSVIASTGVSMYLSKEAVIDTLRQIAALAPGSTLAMTFLLPLDLIPADERAQHEEVYARAKASGTPFISFFSPEEMMELAREAGFKTAHHISTQEMTQRYFSGRTDGLRPASGEVFLIATL